MKVIIVGLGTHGIRHLQALAASSVGKLHVVDPAFCSEDRKDAIVDQLGGYTDLEFHKDLINLNLQVPKFDVAILATTSAVRGELFETCLRGGLAEHYLLEKVLAPNLESLAGLRLGLLSLTGTAVVNCPQRTFPAYRSLLAPDERVETVEFIGDQNAGLACNIIHYIDLVEFFTGCCVVSGSGDRLHTIISSKREGYIDFLGSVEFGFDCGAMLRFSSNPLGTPTALLKIKTNVHTFEVNEISGEIRRNGVLMSDDRMPYQSEMTAKFCASLMEGNCALTELGHSIRQHEIMYEALETAFARLGGISTSFAIS